jgi:hypothetical protein
VAIEETDREGRPRVAIGAAVAIVTIVALEGPGPIRAGDAPDLELARIWRK